MTILRTLSDYWHKPAKEEVVEALKIAGHLSMRSEKGSAHDDRDDYIDIAEGTYVQINEDGVYLTSQEDHITPEMDAAFVLGAAYRASWFPRSGLSVYGNFLEAWKHKDD